MPASVALRPPSMDTSFISSRRNQRTVGGSETQTTLPSVSSWGHDDDADSTDADSQSLLTPTDHCSTDGAGVFDDSDDQEDPLLASRGPANRNSYHQDSLSFAAYRSSIHEDGSTSPKSRPLSICTVKRSSVATCPAESLHKDKDDATVPPSPMFLLPPSWNGPDSTGVRTASMTSSVYSDDIADADDEVHEAQRITFTSPTTRPHLVSVKTIWGRRSSTSGTPRYERSLRQSFTPERPPSVSNRPTRLSTMTAPPTVKEKTTPPVSRNNSKRHTPASVLRASSTKKLPHLSISVSRRSSSSTTSSSQDTPKMVPTPNSQRTLRSRSSPSLAQQQNPWPTRVSSRAVRASDSITSSSPTGPDQGRPASRRASTRTTTSRTTTPTQTPTLYQREPSSAPSTSSPSPSLPPPTPPERPSAPVTPATAKTFSLFPHVRTMSQASEWSTTTAPPLYNAARTRTPTSTTLSGTTTPDPIAEDAPHLVSRTASRKGSIAYLPRTLRGLRQNFNNNSHSHSHHHHTSSSGISTTSSVSSRSLMTSTPPSSSSSPPPPRPAPPPPSASPTSSTHSNPRSIASNAAGLMKSKIMGLKFARKIMDNGS